MRVESRPGGPPNRPARASPTNLDQLLLDACRPPRLRRFADCEDKRCLPFSASPRSGRNNLCFRYGHKLARYLATVDLPEIPRALVVQPQEIGAAISSEIGDGAQVPFQSVMR